VLASQSEHKNQPNKIGRRIRMTSTFLKSKCLPDGADNIHVRAELNGGLAGHVFATRWNYGPLGRICWITQLCVKLEFRRCGLATKVR
jgi:hypothetical protein